MISPRRRSLGANCIWILEVSSCRGRSDAIVSEVFLDVPVVRIVCGVTGISWVVMFTDFFAASKVGVDTAFNADGLVDSSPKLGGMVAIFCLWALW